MAPYAVAFSDDGRGVQSEAVMRSAMREAMRLGKLIAAHCEDNALLNGGYIHAGAYARAHGHRGICSESEWGQIARDLQLVKETGCAYHVCHVSAKESVALIRKAKAEGLTDAEIEERAALRQEYLNAVMANARSVLENTYIVDEKGNKRKLRGKGEGEA